VTGTRVLVTGGGGQVASDLSVLLTPSVDELRALGRAELDVTDDAALASVFAELRPTVVYNCAAFHNVEVCETEVDRSFEVNVRAVKALGQLCASHGAKLVHLSTNYVFDGTAAEPYPEYALPNPRSIYAISKLAGEYAALSYAPSALVVRTAGLYGLHGSVSKGGNFVTRMIARAKEQGALKMVFDQRLTPTYTGDLAAALIECVENDVTGVAHITNAGATSWHGFTEAIMAAAGIEVPVDPVATTVPPGGADRPLNGVLASTRTDVPALRPWQGALGDYMDRAGLLAHAAA
jgi:dTDP-4-dehydrorhamnose reductase